MKNEFLRRKTVNNLEKIRKKKADLANLERLAIKSFYYETDSQTIESVCQVIRTSGHPCEITNIEEMI